MTYNAQELTLVRRAAEQRWIIWLVAPALLFMPLFWISRLNLLGNSDALFYSNILAMMTDALKRGDILPRWLAEANAGFGSPVMLFYAPLAYIVTALINLPLALLHLDVGTQLIIGMYASQIISGYTSFLWLRRSFDEKIAFTCSLLFVLLPYKLIYIYIHVNLAQLWALALLPLWMMAAEDMLKGGRHAVGAYALVTAAVYYTHPLTLIAFGAVAAGYVAWFGRDSLKDNIVRLAAAHVLAAFMMSMQALPGHAYIGWIHAERFFQDRYNWYNNFFHIDVLLCAYYGIIALLMGIAVQRIPALRQNPVARRAFFWVAVLAVVLFLTQRISTWVWQVVTPLQYLQFPAARLHAPALMAAIYLIAIWFTSFKEMLPLGGMAYRRATLGLLICAFAVVTVKRVYDVECDPTLSSGSYLEMGRASKVISTPVPLYETRWGCIDAKRAYGLFEHDKVPPPVRLASGEGTALLLQWQPPAHITFSADIASANGKIEIRQCYLPLWHAQDENGQDLPLAADEAQGILALNLPLGHHQVEIMLKSTPAETLGRALALMALITSFMLIKPEKENILKKHP